MFVLAMTDPGFPRRAYQHQRGCQTYYSTTFSKKLHKNERNLTEKGPSEIFRSRSATGSVLGKDDVSVNGTGPGCATFCLCSVHLYLIYKKYSTDIGTYALYVFDH